MAAVDVDTIVGRTVQEHRQARMRGHDHRVCDRVFRLGNRVRQSGRPGSRDVLDQRPAGGDIQHLHAATNREHRQVALERASRQRQFVRIAPAAGVPGWLGWAMRLNPMTYSLAAIRRCLYIAAPAAAGPVPGLALSVTATIVFGVVAFAAAALVATRKGV